MKKLDRYNTSNLIENQHEPGSRGRVLKNLQGVNSKREMDRLEALEYAAVFEKVVRLYGKNHRFTAKDICDIHRIWLGSIYSWAGVYRSVNISKGNFSFAAARHISSLMLEFEKTILPKYTPCLFKTIEEITEALAVVHVELILIHPFREGNGRLARLLSVLMALQAGLPVLDFKLIRGTEISKYFTAIRKGLDQDYAPMKTIFLKIIERSR